MNRSYHQAQLAKRIKAKYPFVKIGNQYWTSKNFAETSTVLGTPITNVTDNTIWASSETLYTNKYNERIVLGDTVEQATYAAVKVSAFWCDYNNLSSNGLIYGHLYNWYAAKLLQMDIDYYNTANPNNKYVWRIPTHADYIICKNTLGGDATSGTLMKISTSNLSGFSAILNGRRENGIFNNLNYRWKCWTIGPMQSVTLQSDNTRLNIESDFNQGGFSLRFIKA